MERLPGNGKFIGNLLLALAIRCLVLRAHALKLQVTQAKTINNMRFMETTVLGCFIPTVQQHQSMVCVSDVIGVALDMDGGNLYFYKNGTAMNSGNAVATGLTGSWTANCRSGSGVITEIPNLISANAHLRTRHQLVM